MATAVTVIETGLTGYAASLDSPIDIYRLGNQVRLLHDMICTLVKTRLHIACSFMGGTIAALYAGAFPNEVKTLAFISAPLGIISGSPQVRDIFVGIN